MQDDKKYIDSSIIPWSLQSLTLLKEPLVISQLNSILSLEQIFFCNEQKIKSILLQTVVPPLRTHI